VTEKPKTLVECAAILAAGAPLTMDEAATFLRVKRRFFTDVVARSPFYREMGRRKLFFADEIARIKATLTCPSTSGRRARL
jgi:hypothetical protein